MALQQIRASASKCNENQTKILTFLEKQGQIIPEHIVDDIQIPKQTLHYHITQLERKGLVRKVEDSGRAKPRVLTPFGLKVAKFLAGKPWSEEDAIEILTRGLLSDLGIDDPDIKEIDMLLGDIQKGIEKIKENRKESKEIGIV